MKRTLMAIAASAVLSAACKKDVQMPILPGASKPSTIRFVRNADTSDFIKQEVVYGTAQ